MKALVLLLSLLVLLPGCGPYAEENDVSQSLVPWHMWGTSAQVRVPDVSAGTNFQVTQQLARINYKRPETWSFLFAAELEKVPAPNAGNLLVIVEFELITGVGRSNIKIGATDNGQNTGFVRFGWTFAAPAIMPQQVKWTTSTLTPPLDDTAVTPVRQNVDYFPAEDFQVSAKVLTTTAAGAAGDPETLLTLHAYFAPRSHVRPEWFSKVGQFRGQERGGT